jgi:hypothetical protein
MQRNRFCDVTRQYDAMCVQNEHNLLMVSRITIFVTNINHTYFSVLIGGM